MQPIPAEKFTSHSLQTAAWGGAVSRILAAAIQAVDPYPAVHRCMKRQGARLTISGQVYNLADFGRVFVVGAGKASAPMTQACAEILGERVTDGLVIVKEGYARAGGRDQFRVGDWLVEAGHPLPDARGVAASQRMIRLLAETQPSDLVICLISGGGSALLAAPVVGVTLEEMQALTTALLACGATITEINTLRKHLERLKGGQLARIAAPARVATLILSDVIGDPLEVIGSGPTVPDPTTYTDSIAILERYHLLEQVPTAIREHLESGRRSQVPETPKPGDALFERVQNVVIANNLQAAEAALAQARLEGFNTLLLTTSLQGEARQVGGVLAAIARQIAASGQPLPRPACLVAGGETTVTLREPDRTTTRPDKPGQGGRNQEVALGSVLELAGLPQVALVTLATDGGDGPTDAAGAVVTGETLARAARSGLSPADFLARNDAYHFFEPLGDLLKPGPIQTNVNDLAFVFAF